MDLDSAQNRVTCHPSQTDTELFLALKAGEQGALTIFYDRYASLVYRLALRILVNTQEAEDLTQEVFLNLWRSSTYNPSRGSLSSFLTTLTRSRAIDKLRSRSSNLKFLQRWSQAMTTQPQPPTPFEFASIHQRSEYVRDALAKLPDKQRQVLEMAYYDGLSQSEIATRLEIPLGTVKSWSRQGLLNLRQHLKALIE
jgi:RNA polymerase sigma-70 factor (ECF subfamily)